MNFQRELAALVMAGEKTVTRRRMSDKPGSPWFRGGCRVRPGTSHAVTLGRGAGPAIGRIHVTAVTTVRLGDVDALEAAGEGFPSVKAFQKAWRAINGVWEPDEQVYRIEFRVMRPALVATAWCGCTVAALDACDAVDVAGVLEAWRGAGHQVAFAELFDHGAVDAACGHRQSDEDLAALAGAAAVAVGEIERQAAAVNA